MKIIPISLPTPFYIGPVNVYLIAEDPITLIDTGPKTKEANEALREGLRRARIRVSDIRRIVLTHAHEDHCGLARSLRDEAKESQVLVHSWESGHRIGRLEYEEHRTLLARAGVPPAGIESMRKMYEGVRQYADSFETDEYSELRDEEGDPYDGIALEYTNPCCVRKAVLTLPMAAEMDALAELVGIASVPMLLTGTPVCVVAPQFCANAGARRPRRAGARLRRALQPLLSGNQGTSDGGYSSCSQNRHYCLGGSPADVSRGRRRPPISRCFRGSSAP